MFPEKQARPFVKKTLKDLMDEDRAKIMIVDDDRDLLDELQHMLSLGGYDVEIVQDGFRASEEARKIKPDLILMDLKMSPKSGFQVADELQDCPEMKGVPILAMTGFFTEKEHVLMMKLCGIKAHILKPFNPVNLIGKIEFTLRRSIQDQGGKA